jgi:hypothetical protein
MSSVFASGFFEFALAGSTATAPSNKSLPMPNPAIEAGASLCVVPRRRDTAVRWRVRVRAWKQRNPEKIKAHSAVAWAVRRGKLVRQPCEVCGTVKSVHAHHEDYSASAVLDVVWLCRAHHRQRHAERRAAEKASAPASGGERPLRASQKPAHAVRGPGRTERQHARKTLHGARKAKRRPGARL